MEKVLKKILKQEGRYLSRSILLKEGVSPLVPKMIILGVSFFVAGFMIWSLVTEIEEVAITTGAIIPVDNIVKVQHVDGGEIATVHVNDGKKVRKGDALITFDGDKIASLLKQVEVQNKSLELKLKTFEEQIKIKEKLFKNGLNSKMSYLELKIKLTDIKGKILENREVVNRYREQLRRLAIIAPISGYVHDLIAKNDGQVINSGETIMEIVPEKRELRAEVRISPDDIGHVHNEQDVMLKFNTYDFAQYGGKEAKLVEISPTTLIDLQGRPYYRGIVQFSGNFLNQNESLPIKPGMTIAGEVKTGKKTLFQYLIKPLLRTSSNAFRER
jgi:multidrug efflux pump subunit AcrA (membrane-fusion protein)